MTIAHTFAVDGTPALSPVWLLRIKIISCQRCFSLRHPGFCFMTHGKKLKCMEKWTVNVLERSCTCPVWMKKGLSAHELGIQMIRREVIYPTAKALVRTRNGEDQKKHPGHLCESSLLVQHVTAVPRSAFYRNEGIIQRWRNRSFKHYCFQCF